MRTDSEQSGQDWGLDQEIEQTERLATIWERQAKMAQGSAFGEVITSVAYGYRLQLAALLQARDQTSSDDGRAVHLQA